MSATKCYRSKYQDSGILSGKLPKRMMKTGALHVPRVYFDADDQPIPLSPAHIVHYRRGIKDLAEKGKLVPVPLEHQDDAKPMDPTDERWGEMQGYLDDIKMSHDSGEVFFVVQPLEGRDFEKWPAKKTSMEMSPEWDGMSNVVTHLALTGNPVASEQDETWLQSRMSKTVRMSLVGESKWRQIMPQVEPPIEELRREFRMSGIDDKEFEPDMVQKEDTQMPGGEDYQMSDNDDPKDSGPDDETPYVEDAEDLEPNLEEYQEPEPPRMTEDPIDPLPSDANAGMNRCYGVISNYLKDSCGVTIPPADNPQEFVRQMALILEAIAGQQDQPEDEMSEPDEDIFEDPIQDPSSAGVEPGQDPNAKVEQRYGMTMSKNVPQSRRMSKGNKLTFTMGAKTARQAAFERLDRYVSEGRTTPAQAEKVAETIKNSFVPAQMSLNARQDGFDPTVADELLNFIASQPAGSAWDQGTRDARRMSNNAVAVPAGYGGDRGFAGGAADGDDKYSKMSADEIIGELNATLKN